MHETLKPATSELLRYHPHIDGLRAVAILAVVGCHVGLAGFSGGYVGVDIFFVISGFLIITQIVGALKEGRFSFAGFWSRRALRILPPLALVLLVSVGIGCCISVTRLEFFNLGQEAMYAALMGENLLVYGQQGYFDALGTTKPFLHIWSLGVEEQFYLVAPVILFVGVPVFARTPRIVTSSAVALFAASLIGCIWLSGVDPAAAFYLTPFRAWEFIFGGAIGVTVPFLSRYRASEVIGWAGLAMIAASVVLFQPDPRYPSFWAILPVLGSGCFIAAGLFRPESTFARAMSWRPLVGIGLVSYAWYLWHWPLLVFAREYHFGTLHTSEAAALALVALGLAWLTRVGVELPIQRWRKATSQLRWRPAVIGVAGIAVAGAALFMVTGALGPNASPPTGPDIFAAIERGPCNLVVITDPGICTAATHGKPLVLVLGDSHAAAAAPALMPVIEGTGDGLAVAASASCPPILSLTSSEQQFSDQCDRNHRRASDLIIGGKLPIRTVILIGYWQLYEGDGPLPDGRNRLTLVAGKGDGEKDDLADGLAKTVAMLQQNGVTRIIIVGATPVMPSSTEDCILRASKFGVSSEPACDVARSIAMRGADQANDALQSAIALSPGVVFFDPAVAFCDVETCHRTEAGAALFSDDDHPSPLGEAAMVSKLRPALTTALAER